MDAHRKMAPPTGREKRPQNETHLSATLILPFPASRTLGSQILLVKPCSL